MPLIAGLVGSPRFDSFAVVTLNGNDIKVGVLLTAIVNFFLVAAAICFVVDVKEEAAGDPQVALLTEIRDALQQGRHH